MRLSASSSNYIVISCCDALLIFDKRKEDPLPTFIDLPTKVAEEQTVRNAKQGSKLETDVQVSKSGDLVQEKEVVVGCCLSTCDQLVGAITSHKRLLVWRWAEPASWHLSHRWQLVKRPVDLVFDIKGQHVLIADKTGDVLNVSLDDAGQDKGPSAKEASSSDGLEDPGPAPVLLGHLSMLLSLTMSRCGRYVASGDRDEKIRVSSYPRAHNIASFCLGHSEFVSQLRTLPSFPAVLLSASGDGTLRLWNLEDGRELSALDTHKHSHPMALDASLGALNEQHAASTAADHKNANNHTCSDSQDHPGHTNNQTCSDSQDHPGHTNNQTCSISQDDPGHSSGRDRVVPEQCAVVSVAVTTDPSRDRADVAAVVFDKSRTVALYGVSEDQVLRFRCQASLPRPASTVCWLSHDTLVTVCPPATCVSAAEPLLDAADDSSPVLVWRWEGEELTCLPQHHLSAFASQNRHRFQGVYAVDTQVLYKQRYDNVADYQKKKRERLLQQAEQQKQVQEQQMLRRAKRMRMSEPAQEAS